MASDDEVTLSVVVITYNEGDAIRDCLEAVFAACRDTVPFEVIVVDGDSTDRTVSIATEYPVTVLRTVDGTVSTPSSGRYVGTEHAAGEYLLFIDGDTTVADGWITDAIHELETSDEIAGIGGRFNGTDTDATRETVPYLWRTMIYERDALRSIGGFDPYLDALEDVELGFRLRNAGYRLVRLPVVVGRHPEPEHGVLREKLRRWQCGFYYGQGEVIRKYADDPVTAGKWLWRQRLSLGVLGWLGAGGMALATRRPPARGGWLLGTVTLLATSVLFRGPKWTVDKLIGTLVLVPLGLVGGFRRYPTGRSHYPIESVDIVQQVGQLDTASGAHTNRRIDERRK